MSNYVLFKGQCHNFEVEIVLNYRGVTICPGHDTVRISILGSRYLSRYFEQNEKTENEIQITGLFKKY